MTLKSISFFLLANLSMNQVGFIWQRSSIPFQGRVIVFVVSAPEGLMIGSLQRL
jgi:hypothetical protein